MNLDNRRGGMNEWILQKKIDNLENRKKSRIWKTEK